MKNKFFVIVCVIICIIALAFAAINIARYMGINDVDKSALGLPTTSDTYDEDDIVDVKNMTPTQIDISPKTVDFGEVNSDTVLIARYAIRNIGEELLYIQNLKADCICTSSGFDKKIAFPGDSIVITLRLNTSGKEGSNIIFTTFRANTKELEHKLRMKVNVKPV